jgi:hypothetical protein
MSGAEVSSCPCWAADGRERASPIVVPASEPVARAFPPRGWSKAFQLSARCLCSVGARYD